jgi:flagellar biosynthesis/type III secretory pathway protein FliH
MPTVREERHVRIHVGSGAVEATREMLQRWRDAHPETGAAQVLTEPRLAPFCCSVESELGRIELSLEARSLEARSLDVHNEESAPAQSGPDTFFWP